MSEINLETAMLAYLGGDPRSAEYDPFGNDERLLALCRDDTETIKRALEGYLSVMWDCPLDPSLRDLASIADAVTQWLAQQTPQFSETIRRKMASYFTFNIR
jgi:hypothetical protein